VPVGADAKQPVVTREWRLGEARHVFASPRRAEELLRWTASGPFDAGLAEFVPSRVSSALGARAAVDRAPVQRSTESVLSQSMLN